MMWYNFYPTSCVLSISVWRQAWHRSSVIIKNHHDRVLSHWHQGKYSHVNKKHTLQLLHKKYYNIPLLPINGVIHKLQSYRFIVAHAHPTYKYADIYRNMTWTWHLIIQIFRFTALIIIFSHCTCHGSSFFN